MTTKIIFLGEPTMGIGKSMLSKRRQKQIDIKESLRKRLMNREGRWHLNHKPITQKQINDSKVLENFRKIAKNIKLHDKKRLARKMLGV